MLVVWGQEKVYLFLVGVFLNKKNQFDFRDNPDYDVEFDPDSHETFTRGVSQSKDQSTKLWG